MNLLVVFCYNRPKMFEACINTLFRNAGILFDDVLFIDDCSEPGFSMQIANLCVNQGFTYMRHGVNLGYGHAAEAAFDYIKRKNPETVFWIETDYIWRVNWADEALAVLEAAPATIGVSGYSHPDFYRDSHTKGIYPDVIKKEFGSDPIPRETLFQPRMLNTRLGPIQVQGTSNAAGCLIFNWKRVMFLNGKFPRFWEKIIERSCMKHPEGNRRYYGDGTFTHGIAFYWYHLFNPDYGFPWLDICDYSIGNHINGGENSINGYLVPEGQTFAGSPKWDNSYITQNPREHENRVS